MNLIICLAVIFLIASASNHFEKYYIAMMTYFLCPVVWGKGSMMFMPHCEKGHEEEMLERP